MQPTDEAGPGVIKCLVWDLDNTLWSGTLLESDACRMRPRVRRTIEELDRRGILQSVASRNDPDQALRVLDEKRLSDYFLSPQIGWNSKAHSIRVISSQLGVSLDAVALVDDEPFEREQVRLTIPEVRTYPANRAADLPSLGEFSPDVQSAESRSRRRTYRGLADRQQALSNGPMAHSEFLSWCETQLTIRVARKPDLPRIQELLKRTHQLNATGEIWSPEQIASWLERPRWHVYVAELKDRFASYGRIGVAVLREGGEACELVAFLLSCRVLSRGISGFFLAWIRHRASVLGSREIHARFRPSDRNHQMNNLFRLAGLEPDVEDGDGTLRYKGPTLSGVCPPDWLTVKEV